METMVTTSLDTYNTVTNQYNLYVPFEPYSPAELSAMTYQGILRPQFGPYYAHVSVADTSTQRAKSVKMAGDRLIKGDWTAAMLTAAWIHLGGQAPEMLEAETTEYQKSRGRSRLIPLALRHVDYLTREEVAEDDLLVIGGVVVTGLALTIEDLLRLGGTARHQQRAKELAAQTSPDWLYQRFQQNKRLPGMDQAGQMLETLLAELETARAAS